MILGARQGCSGPRQEYWEWGARFGTKSHSRGGDRSIGSNTFVQSTGSTHRGPHTGAEARQVEGEVMRSGVLQETWVWAIRHWFCMH